MVNGRIQHWTRDIRTDKVPGPQSPLSQRLLLHQKPLRTMQALDQQNQVPKAVATPVKHNKAIRVDDHPPKNMTITAPIGLRNALSPKMQSPRTLVSPYMRSAATGRAPILPQTRLGEVLHATQRSPPPQYENLFGRLQQPKPAGERALATMTKPIPRPVEPVPPSNGGRTPNDCLVARPQSERRQPPTGTNLSRARPTRNDLDRSRASSTFGTSRAQHGLAKTHFHRSDQGHLQVRQKAISKSHDSNSHTLRRLRRHPARASMIYRLDAIAQRKTQLVRGVKNLYRAAGIAVGGVSDTVKGACGIPYELYSLIFKDAKAAKDALKHIAPGAGWIGSKEQRLAFGLDPQKYCNLPPAKYEAERHESYFKSPEVKAVLATMTPQEQRLVHADHAEGWYGWLKNASLRTLRD